MPLGVVAMFGEVVLKGTALLVVAFALARVLLNAPAAARHLVWSVALVGVLVIPALSRTIPWKLEVLPAIKGVPVAGAAHADQAQIPLTASLETDRTTGTTATWSPQLPTARQFLSWAPMIWLFGMVVLSVLRRF